MGQQRARENIETGAHRRGGERRHRQKRRRLAHPFPEARESRLGLRAPIDHARGENHGVNRARARAADRFELDLALIEQPIENAPGESPERAAALKGERKTLGRPSRRVGDQNVAGLLQQSHFLHPCIRRAGIHPNCVLQHSPMRQRPLFAASICLRLAAALARPAYQSVSNSWFPRWRPPAPWRRAPSPASPSPRLATSRTRSATPDSLVRPWRGRASARGRGLL